MCLKLVVNAPWSLDEKSSEFGVFSSPYFPVFASNTDTYSVIFGIQSEYGKILTSENSVLGHFLSSKHQQIS